MDPIKAAYDMIPFIEKAKLPETEGSNSKKHLIEMVGKITFGIVEGEKAQRWIGWIQGCVYYGGGATLKEVKAVNKNETNKEKMQRRIQAFDVIGDNCVTWTHAQIGPYIHQNLWYDKHYQHWLTQQYEDHLPGRLVVHKVYDARTSKILTFGYTHWRNAGQKMPDGDY